MHLAAVADEWCAKSLSRQLDLNPVVVRRCQRGWPLRALTGRQILTIRLWLDYSDQHRREAEAFHVEAIRERYSLTQAAYQTVREQVAHIREATGEHNE